MQAEACPVAGVEWSNNTYYGMFVYASLNEAVEYLEQPAVAFFADGTQTVSKRYFADSDEITGARYGILRRYGGNDDIIISYECTYEYCASWFDGRSYEDICDGTGVRSDHNCEPLFDEPPPPETPSEPSSSSALSGKASNKSALCLVAICLYKQK